MTAPISPDPPQSPDPALAANLTATIRADYAALQNDLEQAQELAADFQRQLAGKSNEVAHIKVLLEKTQIDLQRMEGNVDALRAERHRLANEAMEVGDLRDTIESLGANRDHFRRESEALRAALTASGGEFQERINQLELENTRLRTALEQFRNGASKPAGGTSTGVQDRIAELSATIERLESQLRERGAAPGEPAKEENEFINISFGS
ncbi:MAG TPA: hypothetical protein VFG14_04155 [Chthoniobacteraceae bacterium]|nr:hypothetical protein [Chthoniobacteraceae bacterium]